MRFINHLTQLFSFHQLVTEHTHVHHNGSTSLIDLVFVSNPVLTNFCHVISPLSNADHNGIHVQCSWRLTAWHNCVNHSKSRVVWCYKHADWARASTLIDSFDWCSLFSDDVNESWSKWCQQFLSIMNKCIPKRKNLPWLTKRLVNQIKRRNFLYKRGKLPGNLSKYKSMRNKVTRELRKAKQNFFLKSNPRKPKEFWQAVKYLNKQQTTIPSLIDEDGNQAHTSSQKADMLNLFFSRCFNSLSAPLEEVTDNNVCLLYTSPSPRDATLSRMPSSA